MSAGVVCTAPTLNTIAIDIRLYRRVSILVDEEHRAARVKNESLLRARGGLYLDCQKRRGAYPSFRRGVCPHILSQPLLHLLSSPSDVPLTYLVAVSP